MHKKLMAMKTLGEGLNNTVIAFMRVHTPIYHLFVSYGMLNEDTLSLQHI